MKHIRPPGVECAFRGVLFAQVAFTVHQNHEPWTLLVLLSILGFHCDARRFAVATSCLPLAAGLNRSLQLLEAEGSAQARLERIRQLSSQLWQGLQLMPGAKTLLTPEALLGPEAIVTALGRQGIWLRSLADPHCLWPCTHISTEEAEIEQLLEALAQIG
jgi:L-cysteine/cystine lyase